MENYDDQSIECFFLKFLANFFATWPPKKQFLCDSCKEFSMEIKMRQKMCADFEEISLKLPDLDNR
jgi:hypothetical protein